MDRVVRSIAVALRQLAPGYLFEASERRGRVPHDRLEQRFEPSPVEPSERELADAAIDRAGRAVQEIVRNGVETAMNRFNRAVESSAQGGDLG